MLVLALLIGALLSFAPAPAVAGGWASLHWEDEYLVAGQRATARMTDGWSSTAAAQRAVRRQDTLRVYLVPGPAEFAPDPQRAWGGPGAGAVEAPGRVNLRRLDFNRVAVRAVVRIPDLPPGRYHTVLCKPGCERLATNMWPTNVTVVGSKAEAQARLASRLDRRAQRTELRLEQLRFSIDRRIRHARVTTVNTDSALRGDVDQANNEVRRLDAELDRLAAGRDRDLAALRRRGGAAATSGLALLVLCAGLSAALWRARRRPPAPAAPSDDGWERPADRHLVGGAR
ncbi:hypothetical protein BH24ACT14_BH24ACT14_11870 [soil metagenome]